VLTVLMLTVTNYGQATGIRVCIELAEGLLQAAPLYLSIWYKVTELGTGGAILFSIIVGWRLQWFDSLWTRERFLQHPIFQTLAMAVPDRKRHVSWIRLCCVFLSSSSTRTSPLGLHYQ